MWTLPWDTDATWGPTYNCGEDRPYDAVFSSCDGRGDAGGNAELAREYRNIVREVRDILWQTDQISGIINSFASDIAAFMPAERTRWNTVPANLQSQTLPNVVGSYSGVGNNFELSGYIQDMLNFAFTGGNWPGGGVGAGGQAAWLDQLQASGGDGPLIPNTPTISYTGQANFPIGGLAFQTSAFSDPQGNNTFGAIEWRIGEVTNPAAPAYDPNDRFKLEWETAWESGVLTTFNNTISVPLGFVDTGHSYRARVRMRDASGVWSHWSAPLSFTASGPGSTQDLIDHLRVTEIMYNPGPASDEEQALGFGNQDFEFLEFTNTGTQTLDLSQVRIVDGVTFGFTTAAITQLLPGGRLLVVSNIAAFEARYGTGLPIAGAFENGTALANGGEGLKIEDIGNTLIQEFTFDDTGEGWHPTTDGEGYSLVIIDESGPLLSWDTGASWRPSNAIGGSPGSPDFVQGDVDGNNQVNLVDLAILQRHLGTAAGATRSIGDLDGDGDVDRTDAAILAKNFGRTSTPGSPAAAAAAAIRAVVDQREDNAAVAIRRAARPAELTATRRAVVRDASAFDQAVTELSTASAEPLSDRLRGSRSRSRRIS